MNRNAEKILVWIGVGVQMLIFILCLFLVVIFNLSVLNQTGITDEEDIIASFIFNGFFVFAGVLTLVILVLGILSGVWIERKERAASITLIVIGALSLMGNWLSGVLWLIAGIMLYNKLHTQVMPEERPVEGYASKDKNTEDKNNVSENQTNE